MSTLLKSFHMAYSRFFKGRCLLEALILPSTNPQYDKRLFIEFDLPVQYMKTTSSEHVVYINCFECQNKNKKLHCTDQINAVKWRLKFWEVLLTKVKNLQEESRAGIFLKDSRIGKWPRSLRISPDGMQSMHALR